MQALAGVMAREYCRPCIVVRENEGDAGELTPGARATARQVFRERSIPALGDQDGPGDRGTGSGAPKIPSIPFAKSRVAASRCSTSTKATATAPSKS